MKPLNTKLFKDSNRWNIQRTRQGFIRMNNATERAVIVFRPEPTESNREVGQKLTGKNCPSAIACAKRMGLRYLPVLPLLAHNQHRSALSTSRPDNISMIGKYFSRIYTSDNERTILDMIAANFSYDALRVSWFRTESLRQG